MCCLRKKSHHLSALLRKNWILVKRNKASSFCEIFLPVIFIVLLYALRDRIEIKNLPEKSFIDEAKTIDTDFSKSDVQSLFQHCSELDESGGMIAIFPETDITQQIATQLIKANYIRDQGIIFMKNAEELDERVTSSEYDKTTQKICFGIQFNVIRDGYYDYSLRYNQTHIPNQYDYQQQNKYEKQQLSIYDDYYQYGFLHVINLISNVIFKHENPTQQVSPAPDIIPHVLPMKQEKQKEDNFYNLVGSNTNFYIVLPLIITFLRMTNGILTEKEKKIREGMKMMGMENAQFYQSWIITYSLKYFIISFSVSLLLKSFILKDSNFLFLLSWHHLFCSVLVFQSLFISTFFSKARIGLLAAMVFFLAQVVIFWSIDIKSATKSTLTLLAFIPHSAMSLASSNFIYFESNGQNISFQILNEELNGLKQWVIFLGLKLNIIITSILFYYLDQVFPNEFGLRKHPLFFLGMKYSQKPSKKSSKHKSEKVELIQNLYDNDGSDGDEEQSDNILSEEVDGVLKNQIKNNEALVIRNLKKCFYSNGKEKKAVDGLNLEMYNSQVFSFLGHNGAGKSTTISMITGLLAPTSGTISIKGLDVSTQMEEIRKNLGVCPQHDVLYDDLTVKEHLELFATLKNMPKQDQETAIQKIIADVDLVEKTNYLSKNLSGGQKRKLSVAIAFIGGSDVILLDEPTSGMDVEARRHIWDMLKNYKQDKIVILTTHFMDEADYLGDRIGIISDGKLKCVGSSIFLKESYGNGFNFTFVKKENTSSSKPLIKYIKKHLSNCDVISDVSAEVAFQVPKNNIDKFQDFFAMLDQDKDSLFVRSYGISVTTLEQVFLKVASENHNHVKQIEKKSKKDRDVDDFDLSKVKVSGSMNIFKQHFIALFKKRLHIFKRDIGGLFCEVIIPIILIVLGLFAATMVSVDEQANRLLTPDSFSSPEYMYGASNQQISDYFNELPILTETRMVPIKITANTIQQFDTQIFMHKSINLKFGVYLQDNSFNNQTNTIEYYSFANTQNSNAVVISLNLINDAIMTHQTGKSIKIIPRNQPMKFTKRQKDSGQIANGITVAMIFNIGLTFIPASIIVFIVKERITQVKHQQLVSGVSRQAYWQANFWMDIIKYLVPALTCPWLAYAFKVTSLTDSDVFYAFYALFILYGPAIILFTYVFSFLVKDYGSGQLFSFFLHFIFGCIVSITMMVLRLIYKMDNDVVEAITWLFRFMPSFTFSFGVLNLTSRSLYSTISGKQMLNPLDIKIAGGDLIGMVCQIILYFFILVIIEKMGQKKLFSKESNVPYQQKQLDSDVQEEVERVESTDPSDFVVHVKGLRKVFYENASSYKVAVDNINFGIENGEVFCLLGVNGAGKTTTMRMLTGDEPILNGDAYIQGYKIPEQLVNAQQYIGYCPQFDALLDLMTAREHLELYAAIKGIPSDMIPSLVDQKLDELNLRQFEHICAGTYSGGNKRKLSVAIALLGNPPIVFLDEPSTGMDPGNRRFMWDVISKISTQRKQSSIILTTHSMEEAEALSTRVGIMVAGNFQCMGSVQHLKSKFGEGYEIDIKTHLPNQKEIKQYSKVVKMKEQISKDKLKDFLFSVKMQNILYQITENGFCSQLHYEYLKKQEGIEARLLIEFGLMYSKTLKVQEYIHSNFGEFTIIEQFNNFTRYRIHSDKSIGEIFGMFNQVQEELEINHYTVNQPTLEQIFNSIAKKAGNVQLVIEESTDEQSDYEEKKNRNKKKIIKNSKKEIELDNLIINKKSKKSKQKSKEEIDNEEVFESCTTFTDYANNRLQYQNNTTENDDINKKVKKSKSTKKSKDKNKDEDDEEMITYNKKQKKPTQNQKQSDKVDKIQQEHKQNGDIQESNNYYTDNGNGQYNDEYYRQASNSQYSYDQQQSYQQGNRNKNYSAQLSNYGFENQSNGYNNTNGYQDYQNHQSTGNQKEY